MYRQWFTDLEPLGVEGGVLTILVKQDVHRRYLENKAADTFQEAASGDGSIVGSEICRRRELESPLLPATSMGQEVVVLSPDLTFDQFVVGSNNQLANAASIAVCDRPGRSYNPLFLYANVGLGKTHLLQSIGHRLNTTSSQTRWMLTTCEEFSSNFQEALIHQTVSEFRARYRDLDVLLVDDIQELAGREKIQEEFFHTFNALHQAGKQIVLTANAAPSDIPQLEERLISRFASGLVTRIEPPEFENRVAIVHQKAKLHGFQLSENVAAFWPPELMATSVNSKEHLPASTPCTYSSSFPLLWTWPRLLLALMMVMRLDRQPQVFKTSWMQSATTTTSN